MSTLLQNTTLVTDTDHGVEVLFEHDVVYSDGCITIVQPSGSIDLRKMDQIIDGSRHITIPGLINTHHHLYQTLTRGLRCVQNAPLFTWLTELYKRWQHVDYEAIKLAAKVSIAELLLSGCTTTSDHFYLFPRNTDVRVEAVIEAAHELGIRIHACRGSMTLGQSRGGLPPDSCTEDEDQVLNDCQQAVEQFHDPDPMAMCKIDLAPCAPFNVSETLFIETAKLARSLGVLLHTHAAETMDEERFCLERFGLRPMAYLERAGWLGSDVYLAHCVCLNDEEINLIAKSKTGVAHCPCSNMRLGSGIPPIRQLVAAGAHVGVGVDGSSSNDAGHALSEARQALLLQRVLQDPEALTVQDAFRMATIGGARCLNRTTLGRIGPGYAADLAMYRKDDISLAGAVAQDPLAALILCQPHRADRVIVNGAAVVQAGRLTRVDETELACALNDLVSLRFST